MSLGRLAENLRNAAVPETPPSWTERLAAFFRFRLSTTLGSLPEARADFVPIPQDAQLHLEGYSFKPGKHFENFLDTLEKRGLAPLDSLASGAALLASAPPWDETGGPLVLIPDSDDFPGLWVRKGDLPHIKASLAASSKDPVLLEARQKYDQLVKERKRLEESVKNQKAIKQIKRSGILASLSDSLSSDDQAKIQRILSLKQEAQTILDSLGGAWPDSQHFEPSLEQRFEKRNGRWEPVGSESIFNSSEDSRPKEGQMTLVSLDTTSPFDRYPLPRGAYFVGVPKDQTLSQAA